MVLQRQCYTKITFTSMLRVEKSFGRHSLWNSRLCSIYLFISFTHLVNTNRTFRMGGYQRGAETTTMGTTSGSTTMGTTTGTKTVATTTRTTANGATTTGTKTVATITGTTANGATTTGTTMGTIATGTTAGTAMGTTTGTTTMETTTIWTTTTGITMEPTTATKGTTTPGTGLSCHWCLCLFSDNELIIPGYEFTQSHGGGLIIYTKSNLACIHRADLETRDTEMLRLEIKNNVQKQFFMCYCYRPPSALSIWTENAEKAIQHANLEAKEIIMLGDFNFNLMKETCGTKQWLQITDNINLKQLVTDSTRVTSTTKTLITVA